MLSTAPRGATLEATPRPPADTLVDVPGLPGIGQLLALRRDRLTVQRRLAAAGDLTRFRVGRRTLVAASSAAWAGAVLVDHADDFVKSAPLAIYGRPLLGDGLLTSEHDRHRRQRKLLAPAFASRRIASYAATMARLTEDHQAAWRNGTPVDIADEMMRLTLAIVGRTLFDTAIESEATEIGDAVDVAVEYIMSSLTLPIPPRWPVPRNLRMRRAIAALDRTVYRIIRERRAAGIDRGDVLSMLLLARDDDGSAMTDTDVRDEVMTLLLAGHETTANALAWTWLLLARHPHVYDALQAEVHRVLGGRTPTVDDLPALPLALACLKESMRLYPPAHTVGRQAYRDFRFGPVELHRGDIVIVNIYGIHHRPDYYPDPEAFRPERFSEPAERDRPRYRYLPFAGGPRVCIGSHFALMEGQLLLATLAQRCRFQLAETAHVEPEPVVTLRPRGGIPMRVQRRRPR